MGSKFKELVRARIAKTGEGWETAVRHVRGATTSEGASTDTGASAALRGPSSWATHQLTSVVDCLRRNRCLGIDEKLAENRGKFWNVLAELKLAERLSTHLKAPVQLQAGAASDIRLLGDVDCTIEVEHKTATHPFSAVFYPDADTLRSYEEPGAKPWQTASARLHKVVAAMPLVIEPWIDGALEEPRWTRPEREIQESDCGAIADWLATSLQKLAPRSSVELRHSLVRFVISPLAAAPGRFSGAGMDSPTLIREFPSAADPGKALSEILTEGIARKNRIIEAHPERRAGLHLVGLVVDEVIAQSGATLLNTVLGGLVYSSSQKRHFRCVPPHGQSLYRAAQARGRQDILDLAQYDPNEVREDRECVFFDPTVSGQIDGVIALYYTDRLHFVPNPFSTRDISALGRVFPMTLKPFDPERRESKRSEAGPFQEQEP